MRYFFIMLLSSFVLFSIGQVKKNVPDKPFVLGITTEIQSTILSEKRTLNIYLPEGFNDTTRYAVVYLLDGGADEDFIHVAGLYQFNMFEWINGVQKTIVVGIANTDRKRDLTYPTLVQEELQPFIEKKYNTNSSKTIIGQSLGGLFATEVLLKKPRLFNKYIIISPSLWWDNASLLKLKSEILEKNFTTPIDVYIGVGKEGLAPTETPHVMEVEANVLADKLKNSESKSVTIHFDYLPQEDHATISHQAVFNALRILNPVKK